MNITFYTAYPECIFKILEEEGLVTPGCITNCLGGNIQLNYPDDTNYRDIISWISNAIGCGLISQSKIER